MGKKAKKNRFNKSVDVDVVYSSNTIGEVDPTDNMAELNLTKEKVEELQKIRAKLPTFTQAYSIEDELAKLPKDGPFRAFVHNMAFSVTESDIAEFFSPLAVTNINLIGSGSASRGFCFVDFATRDDLAKALAKNDCPLAGRSVNIRIADPNTNDRGGGGTWSRDKPVFSGPRRGDMGGGGGFQRRGAYQPASLRDEMADSSFGSGGGSAGGWRREGPITPSARPSFGFSRPSYGDHGTPSAPAPAASSNNVNPAERPKLNFLPRTAAPLAQTDAGTPRNSKIFGLAKPVDTASKDRLIGERLNQPSAGGACP